MTKTKSHERPSAAKGEDRLPEPDTSATETNNGEQAAEEPWDAELFVLVSTNAEVEVECWWMDGAVTLGDAMLAYPEPMIADNEPFLRSMVNEMLANRVIKAEEGSEEEETVDDEQLIKSEDEKKPDEEKPGPKKEPHLKIKPDIRQSQTKPKPADATPPKKIISTPQEIKVAITEKEKLPEQTLEVTEVADATHDKPTQQPAQNLVASEVITNIDSPAPIEVLSAIDSPLETLEQWPVADEAESDIKQQPEALEVTETRPTALSVIEELPALIELQRMAGQTSEEPAAWLPLAERSEPVELIDEIVGTGEDQPVSAAPDYQIDTAGPIDFGEEDVLITHSKEIDRWIPAIIADNTDREKIPTPQIDDELHFIEHETVDSEPQVQVDVTLKEVESTLVQLSERITASGPQMTEVANKHLDKIIETVAKFELSGRNDVVTEAEVQEELELLCTELFDAVGLNHSPELIAYLARQTFTSHLVDEIEKLKDEEAEGVPQDSAIPPIVKKLIAALRTIKSAVVHTAAIGKAALTLCDFSLQLKLNESF